jgi:hypothetical protein
MYSAIDEQDMEQRFSKLLATVNSDPAQRDSFKSNPLPFLTAAGIYLLPTLPDAATAAQPTAGRVPAAAHKHHLLGGAGGNPAPAAAAAALPPISADVHWWGIDIITNEQFTQDVINGVTDSAGISSALAPILIPLTGITAGTAGVMAAGLALIWVAKTVEIRVLDYGHTGVHWGISWPQLAILGISCAGGPATLVAAATVWLHPLPN